MKNTTYQDLLAITRLAVGGGTPTHEIVPLLSIYCPIRKAERIRRSRQLLHDLSSEAKEVQGVRRVRESLSMSVSLVRLRLAIVEHQVFDRTRSAIAARHIDRIIEMVATAKKEMQPQN